MKRPVLPQSMVSDLSPNYGDAFSGRFKKYGHKRGRVTKEGIVYKGREWKKKEHTGGHGGNA
jgi:hypothetical protein